ncbi:hypothetical protein KPZU09_39110 [Klebsiella pneumoniae]|uniref:Prepilin peptidase A24 N-terminal domain-containing protein n=1 Tax=Klebsiella pneumoniae TaxID=573 RepID=A0A919LVU9_KLEPN|nr:hypothetical protein KPZU09_39110 [Klebsiella pneumoniae]
MTTLAALSLHFPFVWYGFLLLFGLALGSFYNVVIYRLPRMLTQTADDERITLSTPGSSCPQCRQPISGGTISRCSVSSGWAVAPAAVRRPSRGAIR